MGVPTDSKPRENGETTKSIVLQETRLLFELAVPTIFIQQGLSIPWLFVASVIGRNFGALHLDGFTLANNTMNLFCLTVLEGLFTAADTLAPQAYSAGNKKEVGLLAIRGLAISLVMILPINLVLMVYMKDLLIWLRQDPAASQYALEWYRIYSLSLPLFALYSAVWKFLNAQEKTNPLLAGALLSMVVVLPISLETLPNWIGFHGAAVTILIYLAANPLIVILYCAIVKPHDLLTWPGLGAWKEALQWKPVMTYLFLGLGGMVANSEWVYWEAMSLMIGTLGVTDLSVHTIASQFVISVFMLPLAMSIAISVRLGAMIVHNVARARVFAACCFIASVIISALATLGIYFGRDMIFHFFTKDDKVLEGCEEIWQLVCLYSFNLSVYGINTGIAIGLGMQWTLAVVAIVFPWFMGLPTAYYYAILQGGGLKAAWFCMWPPYVFMNLTLVFVLWSKNWHDIATLIRIREGLDTEELESLTLMPIIVTTDPEYGTTTSSSN